ncbi:MAG: condensation domain-containing protein [Fusobacteriota bacterium]
MKKELPSYMIPSFYKHLPEMPLNKNGKIDKKALPKPEKIIREKNIEKKPENRIQSVMIDIFKSVLNIEKISINDNFFQLGGDSLNAIQIMASLYQKGIKVELTHIFEYLTIKEISRYVKKIDRKANQNLVKGEFSLTPIQNWFFRKININQDYWNQWVEIESKNIIDPIILEKAIINLYKHHDLLRTKFVSPPFIKEFRSSDINLMIFDINKKDEKADVIEQIHQSINIKEGQLIQAALIKEKNTSTIYIAIHHLVVDGISWRILIEDLIDGYNQMRKSNNMVELPLKTDSYKKWSKYLETYALKNNNIDYWENIVEKGINISNIPKEKEVGKNIRKDEEVLISNINKKNTDLLLKDIHKTYNTEINDILLSALSLAVRQQFSLEEILINLEGHGRENIIENMDISRTVGWFTSIFPVILTSSDKGVGEVIKRTQKILNQIPNKGIDYGILKYLGKYNFNLNPEISFNYLGKFENKLNRNFVLNDIGLKTSLNSNRIYSLDINCIIKKDKLEIRIGYNKKEFEKNSIEKFMDFYKGSLIKIIEHCLEISDEEINENKMINEIGEEEYNNVLDELEDIF